MKKVILLGIAAMLCCNLSYGQKLNTETFKATVHAADSLYRGYTRATGRLRIKSVVQNGSTLDFYFDGGLSDLPIHSGDVNVLKAYLKENLPERYAKFQIGGIYCDGVSVSRLTVPMPDGSGAAGTSQYSTAAPAYQPQLVQQRLRAPKGLSGRHIALWQSHGYYFNVKDSTWTWQRPCLFQTIEDLYTQSYVVPFLAPMLENAGATVILPRERDWHTEEIIIDNDPSETLSGRIHGTLKADLKKWKKLKGGFSDQSPVYDDWYLPFGSGTALSIAGCTAPAKEEKASWWAEVPSRGEYAVYVTYLAGPKNSTAAIYTIHALDSDRIVKVNQRIGGGTWVYLGTYEFGPGMQKLVTLSNYGSKDHVVADAVKIGGGMGCIARSCPGDPVSKVSGMPRFAEGARYWMQWSGISPEAWDQNEHKEDYRDDFMSRGKWVQYLSGGSSVNPKEKGLGIPVDLSFGFHTDAGTRMDDSIVGTLSIYTLKCEGKATLPNGGNRNTCRELTDIVQTQIVNDLRAEYDSLWNRRMLWNRSYSESRTTGTPAILLELLSHQNFEDMKFGLDPQFRFSVSRACYKGILKYLSVHYGVPYVVQPLPVRDFSARIDATGTQVMLSWRATEDKLESTATPTSFVIQSRKDNGGWDAGTTIAGVRSDDSGYYNVTLNIEPGHIHSYRVRAANEGGISFASETLAVGVPQEWNGQKVMIVNGFNRISGPTWFDGPLYAGFDNRTDSGVPYLRDWSFTGEQTEFHRDIAFGGINDPGFGASHSDFADKVIGGNSFDYPFVHGSSIVKAGYAFESASASTFSENAAAWCEVNSYEGSYPSWKAVDIIYGKECRVRTASRSGIRGGVLDSGMQAALKAVSAKGTGIIISGSYIAKDLYSTIYPIEASVDAEARLESRNFVRNTLGYSFSKSFASRTGSVCVTNAGADVAEHFFPTMEEPLAFPMSPCSKSYCVEAPDGLRPSVKGKSQIYMKYTDTGLGAAIFTDFGSYRVAAFGFPLEIIKNAVQRDLLILDILNKVCKDPICKENQ